MIRAPQANDAVAVLLCVTFAAAAAAAPAPPLRVLAVSPTSPWTLPELERTQVEIVSYDPETGVAHIVADAALEARLLEEGFRLATVEPDFESGRRALQGVPDLGQYHTYAEMVAELQALASAHADVCRLESLGASFEGRDIWALKISDAPEFEDPDEPDVLVVGCHHAREFMTVEVPLHLARTLLEGRATQPQMARIVATRELWIVPMLNVDGHVYQEEFQASPEWMPPGWRKNRRPNFGGSYGVDLNRNYGYFWGHDDEGSSGDPVDETYRGTAPFSELETRLLRALVERQRFVISISYHSYGRLLLYPWGYTRNELPDDAPLFATLADSMVRGNGYRPGNAYHGTIYLTNGEFDDWLHGELSSRKPYRVLPFTVEMNSAAEGGFWPPESLIEPTCAAMLPLNLFALETADNPRAPLPPPRPLVTGTQDPSDGRRIHLTWSQPVDPANAVDHWEVFEVASTAFASQPATIELAESGRRILALDVPRPAGGTVALRLGSELAPLWDWAYLEGRTPGGEWTALPGEPTRADSPTGRNDGNGWSGRFAERSCRFRLDGLSGSRFDLALRLDLHPETRRPARVRAALDLGATFADVRRVLDPDVREPHFDFLAERSGIFAYGVTAVDVHGERTDSDLIFFVIPTVAVRTSDIRVLREGDRIVLRWRQAGDAEARFEAWTRAVSNGEPLAEPSIEWARGDYVLAAAGDFAPGSEAVLEWRAASPSLAILLRGQDADGDQLWGPFVVDRERAGRLLAPIRNPFVPGSMLELELPRATRVRIDISGVDGRVIRRLTDASFGAGRQRFAWDGRDGSGLPVASGVYLVRVAAGGERAVQRLVILH